MSKATISILKSAAALWLLYPVCGQAFQYPLYEEASQLYNNTNTYDLSQETYSTAELFRVEVQEKLNFIPDSYHSPIATRGNSTFVVFVDPGHRPKIAKITNGYATQAFIDPALYQPDEFYGYHAGIETNAADYYRFKFNDGHHTIVVGVDELGYIHVVGDMHNYPYIPSHTHHPLKYVGNYCMYWRSESPYDISSFIYLGDQKLACPQGQGFTYPFFFNDLNGKLYFCSRVHQGSTNGHRAAGCSRYDAVTGQWQVVGGTVGGDDGPRLFFEDDHEWDSTTYSKLRPFGVFDRENNLHISSPILNQSTRPPGVSSSDHYTTDLVYLKSTDDGSSFCKADGTAVAVPARVDKDPDPAVGQADIVATGLFGTEGSVAVDYQNNPYVVSKVFGGGEEIYGWNGSAWTNYGAVGSGADFRLIHDPAGVMNYIPDTVKRFYRFWSPSETPTQVNIPWAIRVIDYEYLKQTGNIIGLAKDESSGSVEMVVVKVEINNRPGMQLITPTNRAPVAIQQSLSTPMNEPLPISLAGSDIDGNTLSYTVVKNPDYGTLSGTAPNLIYTPNKHFGGQDHLVFTVNDGLLDSPAASVLIQVSARE